MPSLSSLPDDYQALVIGESGAIGGALVQLLQADPRCARVVGLGRHSTPVLDLEDDATVASAAHQLEAEGPWHCIFHAAGILHGPHGMPEKRLAQLNLPQMEATFRINTFGPALVLRYFAPLLPAKTRGVMAFLSAKVGSIGDNRLGGWYSYRASKAALNMLVKTAAIELARTHPQATLLALHPGTVASALSAPFNGGSVGVAPLEAATKLLRVVDTLPPDQTGRFISHTGDSLPW